MDLQQALDFEIGERREKALRTALDPFGLPDWSVELIVYMTQNGRPREIAGHQCYELSVSKRKAGRDMGCAPNTFVAAAAHLQRLGVMEIVAFGQQRTYFLSVDRVNALAPIADDPIDELGLFSRPPPADQLANRSALVSAGQRRSERPCREEQEHISRVNREPCSSRGGADQSRTTLRDLTDHDLREWNLPRLRSAFNDAVLQGWLTNSHEDKRKFLALAHHAANSQGIHRPAAVLYAGIKAYEFSRVNQEHWDWAAEFLRSALRYERSAV